MPREPEGRRLGRRLTAVILVAIVGPSLLLSWWSVKAVQMDGERLRRLREERLEAAVRAGLDAVEDEVRVRARAAVEEIDLSSVAASVAAAASASRDPLRGAPADEGPEGYAAAELAAAETRLETARAQSSVVREAFAFDGSLRAVAPRPGRLDAVAGGDAFLDVALASEGETLKGAIGRYEARQALEQRLTAARALELGPPDRRDPAGALAIYADLAADPFDPEVAARARLDLARAQAAAGDAAAALLELDVLARLAPGLKTEGGLTIQAAARLRALELRLADPAEQADAVPQILAFYEDLVEDRLDLPEVERRFFAVRAARDLERVVHSARGPEAPVLAERIATLGRLEARRRARRAWAEEFYRRVVPDLAEYLREPQARPDEVSFLAVVSGDSPRLLAYRVVLAPEETRGGSPDGSPETGSLRPGGPGGPALGAGPPPGRVAVLAGEADGERIPPATAGEPAGAAADRAPARAPDAGEDGGRAPGAGVRGGPPALSGAVEPAAGSAAAIVVGIELDLDRLRAECVEPWLRRLAADRGVAFALLDARGRPLGSSGGKRAVLGGEVERTAAFEALLPFWRLRAVPADDPDEARAAWVRIAIQVGMIALLLAALVTGAVLALRAVHRSLDLARLKADFISNVSHELRTPLTSIRMFNDLLRSGRVRSPEKQQEYLDTVGREAERLQRMIDDILDFARHEAGRKTYELEDADLGDLAGRVVGQMRPELEGEGFKVALDVEKPLPPVRVDPGEVAVAVRNLISNSRKYSPDRKEVSVRVFRDGAARIACEVRDRGAGIDAKDLPRVFEKFYRGGDSLTRGTPGSGLGLAMVKRIVEDMGGGVSAASERGEGSSFTVRFPVAGAGADAAPGSGSEAGTSASAGTVVQ